MNKNNTKKPKNLDVPDFQMESLARVLLPIVQNYLNSKEGQTDWEEWQKHKQLNNTNLINKSECNHKDKK